MRQRPQRAGANKSSRSIPAGAEHPRTTRTTRQSCGSNDPFAAAIEAIYDAALDPSRWSDALQAIADCLGDVGAILLWRRDDGSFGSIASHDVLAAQKDWEQEGWNVRDLRAVRAAERGYFFSGAAFTDRDLFSDEEIRTCPSYTDFQSRHDLGWFGAVAVSPDPHVGVVLSVHRNAKRRPPYSEDELVTVARLGRHVERSLRLSVRLFDSELQKTGLGEALTRVGIGVFVLDSLGRVVFTNPAGQNLLGDGLELSGDHRPIGAAPVRASLRTAIEHITRAIPKGIASDHKPILINRQKAGRPLAVYVLPMAPSSHPAAQFLSHGRAIMLAIDPKAGSPPDPSLVRDVLGLTLGEARVAAFVGAGLTPREAALRLGITEETARTALKHVFSKTGVSRQSELVALLSKMLLH